MPNEAIRLRAIAHSQSPCSWHTVGPTQAIRGNDNLEVITGILLPRLTYFWSFATFFGSVKKRTLLSSLDYVPAWRLYMVFRLKAHIYWKPYISGQLIHLLI